MKLFITGAAGFIGANFVHYWMKKHPKDELVLFDKLCYSGGAERLEWLKQFGDYEFLQGDLVNYEQLQEGLKGCDAVVHFAAETHVDTSLGGRTAELHFLRSNVEGTINLLYAAKEAGVKKFHHVSTDEVYGQLALDAEEKFHEETKLNPRNPYSVSKATSDLIVRNFGERYGFHVTISNCSNNYGIFQTPEKLIPRSIYFLATERKIQLYTDKNGVPGKNVRDWLHVDDHSTAIEVILEKGRSCHTYCLGGEGEMNNYDLIVQMLEIASDCLGHPVNFDNGVELVKDRPMHDLRYAINYEKIQTELGWNPAVSFEEGFRSVVEWYFSEEGIHWLKTMSEYAGDVRKEQSSKVEE